MFIQISKHDLPLTPEKLVGVTNFCRAQIEAGNFRVLGQIPDVLRKDWLDERLDAEVRANRHTHVDPVEWRSELEGVCEGVVKAYLQECGEGKNTVALLMWRAALAFHKVLVVYGIWSYHIDVKRNEVTLEVTERLPLNEVDKKLLRDLGDNGQVFIPDPMLASGSSMSYAIDMLKRLGIRHSQITVGCVVAAPEGVFNLLNQFPGIKIIAATLDGCLNNNAYIVNRGLGDAGAKYFCGNTPDNFYKGMFTDEQWEHLVRLLEMTNK